MWIRCAKRVQSPRGTLFTKALSTALESSHDYTCLLSKASLVFHLVYVVYMLFQVPLPPGELILPTPYLVQVLDEVRPYLIADGGNVRVMGVDEETRVVS